MANENDDSDIIDLSTNAVFVEAKAPTGFETAHLPVAAEEHRRLMERTRLEADLQSARDKRLHEHQSERDKQLHEHRKDSVHSWFARVVASVAVCFALWFAVREGAATAPGRDVVMAVLGAALSYLFVKQS